MDGKRGGLVIGLMAAGLIFAACGDDSKTVVTVTESVPATAESESDLPASASTSASDTGSIASAESSSAPATAESTSTVDISTEEELADPTTGAVEGSLETTGEVTPGEPPDTPSQPIYTGSARAIAVRLADFPGGWSEAADATRTSLAAAYEGRPARDYRPMSRKLKAYFSRAFESGTGFDAPYIDAQVFRYASIGDARAGRKAVVLAVKTRRPDEDKRRATAYNLPVNLGPDATGLRLAIADDSGERVVTYAVWRRANLVAAIRIVATFGEESEAFSRALRRQDIRFRKAIPA